MTASRSLGSSLPYRERHYTTGASTFERETTIKHWQLRDLISAGDSEYEFYCVCDRQTIEYDTRTQHSKIIQNLSFEANSMTCRHRFLAAGGMHGQLDLRDLRSSYPTFKGTLGHSVNNSLHMAKDASGDVRLFVCSNDDCIYVYKVPTMANVTTVRCSAPINYTAQSPDKTRLVCVGDFNQTHLYRATPTGYELEHVFLEASDVGMCCAWSHYGSYFASTHQDGTACIWDHRSRKVVAKLSCSPGAFRNVKFSAGPIDLMAVAQHEDHVHLVDARKFNELQTLDVLAPDTAMPDLSGRRSAAGRAAGSGADADICGISFSPSGTRLYVGLKEAVVAYDISTLARTTFACGELR